MPYVIPLLMFLNSLIFMQYFIITGKEYKSMRGWEGSDAVLRPGSSNVAYSVCTFFKFCNYISISFKTLVADINT